MAALKSAQSQALQSQIDSHFLYNYLENINLEGMIALGEDNKVSKMVRVLSSLLQLSLNNNKSLISLAEELDHIHLYMEAQRFRYGDDFEVVWQVPDSLKEYRIIKLTLQPVVENIFIHALPHARQKLFIRIRGYEDDSYFYIQISDNGPGIPAESLKPLRERIGLASTEGGKHIGLPNVSKRLKLLFDLNDGITVESNGREGTTVTIKTLKATSP